MIRFSFILLLLISRITFAGCKNEGFTPDEIELFDACSTGITEKALLLIDKNIYVNLCNKKGYTCLHMAAIKGDYTVIEALLNRGADLRARTQQDGFTPIHLAAISGIIQSPSENILEKLSRMIKANSTGYETYSNSKLLDIEDNHGNTALHYAVLNENSEMVTALVALGAREEKLADRRLEKRKRDQTPCADDEQEYRNPLKRSRNSNDLQSLENLISLDALKPFRWFPEPPAPGSIAHDVDDDWALSYEDQQGIF